MELTLYHTGFQVVEAPNPGFGRHNADFGRGFYLSDDREFSKRWARARRGQTTYLNAYALELAGLKVRRLTRDAQWLSYIFANRAQQPDIHADADVLIGPIANDTIYDTWGILTSGLLPPEQALRVLMLGPGYEQTVVKTRAAAAALRFLGAEELKSEEIAAYRETVAAEEAQFQAQLARLLDDAGEP